MTVAVNSVVVNFKSPAFHASFQLSRLCLDSRTPAWQRSDLRMTRLKEPDRAELLIFKQLEWQTLRVEATAVRLEEKFLTPLRLITNQARCRITIKKRLSDCSVLGSRLVLILDDLLWVLTDSQLKAALHFANSLSGLVQRATELAQKTKAARKLESLVPTPIITATPHQQRQATGPRPPVSAVTRMFRLHDVVETSYHFCSGQIDLHLCDEVSPEELRSCHPQLADGGAMQISFHNLAIDYYPYHLASGDRKHWLRYKESSTSRSGWVSSLLADFRQRLNELVQGESARMHTPVHRTMPHLAEQQELLRRGVPSSKGTLGVYLSRLMSMCLVIRMDDFTIFRVSTAGTRNGTPQKFVGSDKGRLLLPADLAAVHIEFTQYYYPGDSDIPVPPQNVFVQLNPIQVTFDALTILWLNAFMLNLQRSQMLLQSPVDQPKPTVDIRVEALMPRICIPSEKEYTDQPDRPKQLQIQISRLIVTNSRIGEQCGRMELGKCLETFQQGDLFFCSTFPSTENDFHPVIDAFVEHSLSRDRQGLNGRIDDPAEGSKTTDYTRDGVRDLFDKMQTDQLWSENKNIWCVSMDPVWADFSGVEANRHRPVPFLDAFPLTMWVYQKPSTWKVKRCYGNNVFAEDLARDLGNTNTNTAASGSANIHVLAHIQSLVNVQVNHYQYVFLLRAIDAVSELSKHLAIDTSHITCEPVLDVASSCMAVLFPELDVSFVMPGASAPAAKTNSGGENDENDSLNSGESIHTDVANTPNGSRLNLVPNGEMKGSVSDHVALKDGHEREREGSIAGSMTKSISDSLLDNKSLHNGSPGDSPMMRSQEMLHAMKIHEEDETTSVASSLPRFSHGHRGSGDWAHLEKVPDNLTRTLVSGSSAVKKGFSSFISSLDSAIASGRTSVQVPTFEKRERGPSPEDSQGLEDWETMSIRSDMSSDSDQFLMVHMDNQSTRLEDALFSFKESGPAKVERANEMKEDSNSNPSSSSIKRLDMLSVLTLRMGKSEYIQHSHGFDSVIRFQCSQIGTEEYGNISWDEFQTKFCARSRGWQEMQSDSVLTSCELKVRLESGPSAEELCPQAGEVGIMTMIAKDVSLPLLMSNASGLGDFAEDEVIVPPMPLRLYVHNFTTRVEENRPPANLSSPGSVPLDISIAAMTVRRETDGVFHIHAVDPDVSDFITHSIPWSPTKSGSARLMLMRAQQTYERATKPVPKPVMVHRPVSTQYALAPRIADGFDKPGSLMNSTIAMTHSANGKSNSLESLIEANEQLRLKLLVLDSLQAENEQLREQVALQTTRADEAVQRQRELEEEVLHLEEEKHSLLATRNVLQDELVALEKRRGPFTDNQNATG